MADSFVRVPADSTGKRVDASSLDVGGTVIYRQRIVIGDNSGTNSYALVTNGALTVAGTFNLSGTATVAGNITISGTAQVAIGTPFTVNDISRTVQVALSTPFTVNDISRTVQVAIATPFVVNNVSATVVVAGVVGLTASTANIGRINDISATVTVAGVVGLTAGTANIGRINDISATVNVAGNVNISATAIVAGVVGLTAGTANIGRINDISATVTIAGNVNISAGSVAISGTTTIVVAGFTPTIMSTSHGPKCVTASTSANVTLIASPGTGLFVHITQLMVGNFSQTKTLARIGTSASANTVVQPIAANGGGFVLNFDPPWKLSASEAAICSVKPNAADAYFTVNFFVA